MESLIKSGTFDSLGDRGTLLHNVNDILSLAQREQKLRESGQSTMFDLWGETTALPMPSLDMEYSSVTDREMAGWEKELTGVSFSKKLIDPTKYNPDVTLCATIDGEMNGDNITIIGEIESVTYLVTRKDSRQFAKAVIEDISGSVEAIVWSRVYEATRDIWQEGNQVQIDATVRIRDDEVNIAVNKADIYELPMIDGGEITTPEVAKTAPPVEEPAEEVAAVVIPEPARRLTIEMKQTDDHDGDLERLQKLNSIIRQFSGEDEVILRLENGTKIDILGLPSTGYCPELHGKLTELMGEDKVKVETTG
jgi:DNA polymerase-3 subunit alpha